MLGVALTATVTAAAGPIAFIALAAPQIARRITRSAGVTLIASALTGSSLLAAADYAAQHAFQTQLPVGIMTVSIGGIYFISLLVKEDEGEETVAADKTQRSRTFEAQASRS
ncbi:iron chelate uptake ABC transporter family permease subunit [Brucella gallinifaecis]|uniref:iron chelate uptake ABC transporter family permease subunit n=1 Tax=Brucella gallinifaecis TaxID=215590 RepID=UPI00235FEFFA|nr:iron chelate uptake ABC transporter family permease subunit [Brucella gallinifaecis]